MPAKKKHKHLFHKIITYIIGIVFLSAVICGGFYLTKNFKKIMVSLNLPITLPADWYPDAESQAITNESKNTSSSSDTANLSSSGINKTDWFDQYLSNFILIDFDPFTKASELDNSKLILFGIFSALSDPKSDNYSYTDNGETIVPAADVESMAKEMLNADVKNATVGDFKYSSAKKEYYLPAQGFDTPYMTLISNIQTLTDNKVEITIDFYPPQGENAAQPSPDKLVKTMIATLKGSGENYQIISYKKR